MSAVWSERSARVREGTRWLPAERWRSLVCAVRGHVWESQPMSPGFVIVLCDRCGELVAAPFVDVPDVLGSVPLGARSRALGEEAAGRVAVDLVCAAFMGDGASWRRARSAAVSRPGESIDALVQLAAVMAPAREEAGVRLARRVGLLHELGLLADVEGGGS